VRWLGDDATGDEWRYRGAEATALPASWSRVTLTELHRATSAKVARRNGQAIRTRGGPNRRISPVDAEPMQE
jgi:hypothetical protein